MEWHLDRRRNVYSRSVSSTQNEVVGRFSIPSDSILPSLSALLPLVDVFSRYGKADVDSAPGCLRLTVGKVQKIPVEVLEWAVKEGIVVAIERREKTIAYRLSEVWQPWLLERCMIIQNSQKIDWKQLDLVYERYGKLGLRIAAQIGYGDSHSLDGAQIPPAYLEKVWVYPDAIVRGANVVRIGGRITLTTPWMTFNERWSPPGHYLWSWDIEAADTGLLRSASQVLLVENPYAFWSLLGQYYGQDYSFICLHGETRQPGFLTEDAALYQLFQKLLMQPNSPHFLIWCDPDPGGLVMASNAQNIIRKLGGESTFFRMRPDCLDQLETVVMAERKLLPLTEEDRQILGAGMIHPDLQPLANAIQKKGQKGEQEALTCLI